MRIYLHVLNSNSLKIKLNPISHMCAFHKQNNDEVDSFLSSLFIPLLHFRPHKRFNTHKEYIIKLNTNKTYADPQHTNIFMLYHQQHIYFLNFHCENATTSCRRRSTNQPRIRAGVFFFV